MVVETTPMEYNLDTVVVAKQKELKSFTCWWPIIIQLITAVWWWTHSIVTSEWTYWRSSSIQSILHWTLESRSSVYGYSVFIRWSQSFCCLFLFCHFTTLTTGIPWVPSCIRLGESQLHLVLNQFMNSLNSPLISKAATAWEHNFTDLKWGHLSSHSYLNPFTDIKWGADPDLDFTIFSLGPNPGAGTIALTSETREAAFSRFLQWLCMVTVYLQQHPSGKQDLFLSCSTLFISCGKLSDGYVLTASIWYYICGSMMNGWS